MLQNKLYLLIVSMLTIFVLAACGGASAQTVQTTAAPGGSTREVHMNDSKFLPETITIRQGDSITLIADTFMPHFIANGTWQNNAPRPAVENGAPKVENLRIDGNGSGIIGPFESAGTFQFYCTIHPGMNLTVVVK